MPFICIIGIYISQENMKNRQKSHTKNSSNQLIIDLAKKIEEQRTNFDQAGKILNAYRKIEDIKVPISTQKLQKNKTTQPTSNTSKITTSKYSNKVKQTLRQMNVNRSKQMGTKKQIFHKVHKKQEIWQSQKSAAQRHLMNRATQKIFNLMCKKYSNICIRIFGQIVSYTNQETQVQQDYNYRIRLYKLRKIFDRWSEQTILTKIQKQREITKQKQKQHKNNKLATSFHNFSVLKKALKLWKASHKQHKKKKQLQIQRQKQLQYKKQEQLRKKQALMNQILNEGQQQEQQKPVVQNGQQKDKYKNIQLENKLNGFLNNLKKQVNNKGRLNTIKQKTQQSQIRIRKQQASYQQHSLQQQEQSSQKRQVQQINNQQNSHINKQQDILQKKGPLTNQQLQLKRKKLAEKAKNRKQTLQKMKKQKQQKKKQQQQQRLQLQKQIEQQNKKQRKQQYRKYLQQKKQQQQWQIRQSQLTRQASQFNKIRLMKYYGWIEWIRIKQINQNYANKIEQVLTKITLKRKYAIFVENISQISSQKLNKLYQKADYHQRTKLKSSVIKKLINWKNQQIQEKQELFVRHQINTQKIYLALWKRARNTIQLQNFEWERPRLKKAQYFYSLNLLHKAYESIKENKNVQIQTRTIQQHKKKIQSKLLDIVQSQPTIDYSQFL